ncbi:HAD-like protein [Podospora fimiseda]|uniref:HAD-like protein n=1 Tax=Podospora fimiseda TaxID=252190 RepID=A0AAN6YPR1_9PEZI|nr:HAD-like protein [Podospora fimiseda]
MSESPIRACIFDLDGLLINTEDLYTLAANTILARHNRPPLPWNIKTQMMGVPGSSTGEIFHSWAQLPISREQYAAELAEEQTRVFPTCKPMPGAKQLLSTLTRRTDIQIALASSSVVPTFEKKTAGKEVKAFLGMIPEDRRVLADNRVMKDSERTLGRKAQGKPAPDFFLIALGAINFSLPIGVEKITPEECLVFEDSLAGVEAGKRAGMRVIWVPHPQLAVDEGTADERVLRLRSLDDFDFAKYKIKVVPEMPKSVI